MNDEIRIESIELENYRQYYGKHKIKLSNREEGFTIIAGENGGGKSNLLNAINWCLYHEEPHGMKGKKGQPNKTLSIINTRYIKEIPEERSAQTSVEIWLKKGDVIYSISRILKVVKHKLEYKELSNGEPVLLITQYGNDRVPKGCEIFEHENSFVVKKKGANDFDFHDTLSDGDPNTLVNEILPKTLSKYFLLDGEFLEGFWKDFDIIKDGIENISQLNLLSSLKEHVDKMKIPPKGLGKETDTIRAKLERLLWHEKSFDENGVEKFSEETRWTENDEEDTSYYHATGDPRIKEMQKDKKKIHNRMTDILNKMSAISSPNAKILNEQLRDKSKDFEEEKEKLNALQKKYRYNLITKSPYVFLENAINKSVKTIESRMELGDLPIRQRNQFADDLLEKGSCICGETLSSNIIDGNETNKRRISVESFKNTLKGKSDLDAAVNMKFDYRHDFIDHHNAFLKLNFGDLRIELDKSQTKFDNLNNEIKGIKIQLGSCGDKEIEVLISNHTYLVGSIDHLDKQIIKFENDLTRIRTKIRDERVVLDRAMKKEKTAKLAHHELKIWEKIDEHIEQVYEELKEEIRIDIQDNTWRKFRELYTKPEEFKSFRIESDYSTYMLDIHNANKISNLSAGQSLILTLAFVTTLREPTGYKFPLVVDSPLGKIDGGNKYNIGTRLPDYLPHEQLTLLVTDTEYTANLPPDPDHLDLPTTPVAKLLNDKISLKHFKIQKGKGDNVGNSNIVPAKLEFEDKKGWMVSANV